MFLNVPLHWRFVPAAKFAMWTLQTFLMGHLEMHRQVSCGMFPLKFLATYLTEPDGALWILLLHSLFVAPFEVLLVVPLQEVLSALLTQPLPLGGDSIEKCWLEFMLEKSLEFWLEIPYTDNVQKTG